MVIKTFRKDDVCMAGVVFSERFDHHAARSAMSLLLSCRGMMKTFRKDEA
jgi:hypothetical protein